MGQFYYGANIITHIGPKPPHIGAARRQYRHGGVITMQPLGCQHMRINQDHQRRDRCGAGAHPIPDRRGAEVDALSPYPSGEPHLPFQVKPLSSVLMDDLKVAHKYGG